VAAIVEDFGSDGTNRDEPVDGIAGPRAISNDFCCRGAATRSRKRRGRAGRGGKPWPMPLQDRELFEDFDLRVRAIAPRFNPRDSSESRGFLRFCCRCRRASRGSGRPDRFRVRPLSTPGDGNSRVLLGQVDRIVFGLAEIRIETLVASLAAAGAWSTEFTATCGLIRAFRIACK
jgi:hypothetical protein